LIIDKNTNLSKFWLLEDSLSMTNNLYFGLGKSYFCGHGCKVCFIHDELKLLKKTTQKIYNNDLTVMQKVWNDLYTFFETVSLDEDPYFFKLNHPKEYDWYLNNSHKCSYSTTDNGIFRISKLKDIKFKSMSEIALSMSFIEKVGQKKIIDCLDLLIPIEKMKFIVDKDNFYPEKIISWAQEKDMPMVVHKMNFLTKIKTNFELKGFEDVQIVNWVFGKEKEELIKIHTNCDTILYYNNFYYSNNISDDPYHTLEINEFDYKKFLSNMLMGKQRDYLKYSKIVQDKYLKEYFLHTQNYNVNLNYNFIPNFMVNYKIKFFNRMIEKGWVATKYGLLEKNAVKIVPIIERIDNVL
jgi:hypothetical protein